MSLKVVRNGAGPKKTDFKTALQISEEQNMRLVSIKSSEDSPIADPHWTGDLVLYPGKGKPFSEKIQFNDNSSLYILNEYRFESLKNVAIIIPSGSYKFIVDGRYNIIAPKENVLTYHMVFNFPDDSGLRHPINSATGLPVSVAGGRFELTTLLFRNDCETISPAVRAYQNDNYEIHLTNGFNNQNAIVLEE